jgi:multidrug efflux pump subunit AcrB
MLFWPGVPGEFMGMLPVTLIFVLSASLVVALVYLPVMGGGRQPRAGARYGLRQLRERLLPPRDGTVEAGYSRSPFGMP